VASDQALNLIEAPRRAGDPPVLVAMVKKIRKVIGWTPKYDDLDSIVRSSLAWERKIAAADPTAYWKE
jgi:UDP-glucose 4-epimerase